MSNRLPFKSALSMWTPTTSAPARAVNVSSRAHEDVKGLDLDDLHARAREVLVRVAERRGRRGHIVTEIVR
jgi:hypothetical protein